MDVFILIILLLLFITAQWQNCEILLFIERTIVIINIIILSHRVDKNLEYKDLVKNILNMLYI